MERMTKLRSRLLLVLFGVILSLFTFRLYQEQVFKTGGLPADNTTTYTTWTRVKAARGDILDRNGNVLVGNRASYDLVINHYVLRNSASPNRSIYDLVMLCKEQGIEYTDRFPITQTRPFTYTLDEYNSAWRGYFQKFLYDRGELDSDISAPLLIQTLRESYQIPEEWSDEEARLVIGIRYELTLRDLTTLPNFVFIEDVSDEDLSSILELSTPGMNVESSTVREYHTKYAAHILGYVGAMDAEQWAYYKTLGNYSMDAEVGQAGFELAFEQYLHGTDGVRVDVVSTDGTVIESYYKEAPKAGNNVEVTIDINLQMAAEQELEKVILAARANEEENAAGKDAEGASVVAMDPNTGEILVCASYPTYDLSTFFENYDAILEDRYKPLFNRALQAIYPPGSTYKMSMVIAAINSGYMNMTDTIEDKGVFMFEGYDDFDAKCLHYSKTGLTHGHINASMALCVSCNYFFYELGSKLSTEITDGVAQNLGLGEPTGVELPEKVGYRANAETKKMLYADDSSNWGWYSADRVLSAMGQSENRFTPLQLCVYASTLANRGTRYAATFLNRVVSTDYRSLIEENHPEILDQFTISDDAYYAYIEGMKMVATYADRDFQGTAYKLFRNYPIEVCAKTGTAQTGIRNVSDNGAFICFAPAKSPQIAIAVYGEKSGSGSTMGQVAKAMLDAYFEVGEIGDVPIYENQLS